MRQTIGETRRISLNEKKKLFRFHRNPKLLATYASNINWPRSVCCLTGEDNSIIVCEQDRCRLVLFTSQLMLRSTCGGQRGNGQYEFDSPWNVASLTIVSNSSSWILVADTNNRRVQCFSIGYQDRFIYKQTLKTKEKPFFIATNNEHIAVSCENGVIETFLSEDRRQLARIELNKSTFMQKKKLSNAFPICLDKETSSLFLGNTISSVSTIYQLTITGEFIRTIEFVHYPFLRINSMIFDNYDQQIIISDSFNSVIYSIDPDLDEDNIQILLKRSDKVNCPQDLSVGSEGHLILVECSVNTEHALKIFRHHPCQCHSRRKASSLKTSETKSVRSMIFSYSINET